MSIFYTLPEDRSYVYSLSCYSLFRPGKCLAISVARIRSVINFFVFVTLEENFNNLASSDRSVRAKKFWICIFYSTASFWCSWASFVVLGWFFREANLKLMKKFVFYFFRSDDFFVRMGHFHLIFFVYLAENWGPMFFEGHMNIL